MRWATVIENVLTIRNAPTNSEMPANTSRNVRRKPSWSWMSLASDAACSWPVRTVYGVRRQRGADVRGQLLGVVPACAADLDRVELAAEVEQSLRDRRRHDRDRRAAERGLVAELRDADEPERLLRPLAGQPHRVAELEAGLVDVRLVERDLARRPRRVALDVAERR